MAKNLNKGLNTSNMGCVHLEINFVQRNATSSKVCMNSSLSVCICWVTFESAYIMQQHPMFVHFRQMHW